MGCAAGKLDGTAVGPYLNRLDQRSSPERRYGAGVRQVEQEGNRGAIRGARREAVGGPGSHRNKISDDDTHRQLGVRLAELDGGSPGRISEKVRPRTAAL